MIGRGATTNKIIREWGDRKPFKFKGKEHLDLATTLGWISMERGAKVTGSAFPFFMGGGARLERALVNFMVDLQKKTIYTNRFH